MALLDEIGSDPFGNLARFADERLETIALEMNALCHKVANVPLPVAIGEVWMSIVEDPEYSYYKKASVICCPEVVDDKIVFTTAYNKLEKMLLLADLHPYESKYKTLADAIAEVIADNPEEYIGDSKVTLINYVRIYQEWLKGVRWTACFITWNNRPSSASWDGYPWEWHHIVPRVIKHTAVIEASVSARAPRGVEGWTRVWKKGDNVEINIDKSETYAVIKEAIKKSKELIASKKVEREKELKADTLIDPETKEAYKPTMTKSEIDEIASSRQGYRLHYQVDIFIDNSATKVSRTLVISGAVNLDNLHKIICIAFGWDEDCKYQFVLADNTTIAKRQRGGRTPSKTKWTDIAPYLGDKVGYINNGKWGLAMQNRKINFKRNLDCVPRCVKAIGEAPDQDADPPKEKQDAETTSTSKKRKQVEIDVDDINENYMGKRFGANASSNKVPKNGPNMWIMADATEEDIRDSMMEVYRKELK